MIFATSLLMTCPITRPHQKSKFPSHRHVERLVLMFLFESVGSKLFNVPHQCKTKHSLTLALFVFDDLGFTKMYWLQFQMWTWSHTIWNKTWCSQVSWQRRRKHRIPYFSLFLNTYARVQVTLLQDTRQISLWYDKHKAITHVTLMAVLDTWWVGNRWESGELCQLKQSVTSLQFA